VYDAIKVELARSIKSGFLKHNNEAFRKAIYDKEYRNYIITTFDLNPFKEKEMKEIISTNFLLNRILYGPPGTGKTYKLKKDHFSEYTIKETSITREQFFEEEVRNLTWWQVIGLALLELGVSRVGDILENRWVSEKARLSESKNIRATIWGTL